MGIRRFESTFKTAEKNKGKKPFFAKKQEKKTSRMEIFVVVYNTSIEVVLVSAKRRTFKLLSKREMCLLFTRCRLCAFVGAFR